MPTTNKEFAYQANIIAQDEAKVTELLRLVYWSMPRLKPEDKPFAEEYLNGVIRGARKQ